MTTIKQAKAILSPLNISLTKTTGDYRVAFKGLGNEATAYYTSGTTQADLIDAIDTGKAMAREAGII